MGSFLVNVLLLILAALGVAFMVYALWGFYRASSRP